MDPLRKGCKDHRWWGHCLPDRTNLSYSLKGELLDVKIKTEQRKLWSFSFFKNSSGGVSLKTHLASCTETLA